MISSVKTLRIFAGGLDLVVKTLVVPLKALERGAEKVIQKTRYAVPTIKLKATSILAREIDSQRAARSRLLSQKRIEMRRLERQQEALTISAQLCEGYINRFKAQLPAENADI